MKPLLAGNDSHVNIRGTLELLKIEPRMLQMNWLNTRSNPLGHDTDGPISEKI